MRHKRGNAPNPDVLVEPDDAIASYDVETNFGEIIEMGMAKTSYSLSGGWTNPIDDPAFNRVICVSRRASWGRSLIECNHYELRKLCHDSTITFQQAWTDLLEKLREYKGSAPRIWLKAHNGIAADMRWTVASAKRAGIVDPISDLIAAGVAGIIDPARIILAHKITSLQPQRTAT